MQKLERLALFMVVLGVIGALMNVIFQRKLGLILFVSMTIVGIIILGIMETYLERIEQITCMNRNW